MSTRSTIWIQGENREFKGVYCHGGGAFDGVGKKLFEHYSDEDRLNSLIDLGSMSNLASEFLIPSGVKHSFDNKLEGMTTFYCRDRGEDLDVRSCKNIEDVKEFYEEYNYIFDTENKTWYVSEHGAELETLKSALEHS